MIETHAGGSRLTDEAPIRYLLNETEFRACCARLDAHTIAEQIAVAGISRASLNRWRRGSVTPSLPVLDRMTKRLGTTRERLVSEVIA